MQPENSRQEKGQILVILVLALVVLLAFTALAVDVGMVYADRRYDQNVADSVALAGSAAASKTMISAYRTVPEKMDGTSENFYCSSTDIADLRFTDHRDPNATDPALRPDPEHYYPYFDITNYNPPPANWQDEWVKIAMHDAYEAAKSRGTTNGFTLPVVLTSAEFQAADQGIYIECVVSATQEETGIYTYTKVSSTTKSSFAHFIFGGPLKNTVTAVALSKPFTSLFGGYALISMDPDSCGNGQNQGGIWFDGSGEVTIHDGGALADTCIAKNGATGSINLEGGDAEYNTGSEDCTQFFDVVDTDGDGDFETQTPTCTEPAEGPVERKELPVPECDLLTDYTTTNLSPTAIMEPGHYLNSVSINGSNFNITMNPGLYCFDNGFTATANGATPNATLKGEGVTIYMKNGLFSMTGQAGYILSAPFFADEVHYNEAIDHHALAGFLVIYRYAQSTPDCQDANVTDVKMEGSSSATYTGTIYAPCSQVDFGGTSDLVNSTAQIIGNTIKIHGSPTSDLYYDASKMGLLSPEADLQQ